MEADSNLACFFSRHPRVTPSSKTNYSRPIQDVVTDGAGLVEVMQIVCTGVNLNLDMPEYETLELHRLALMIYRWACIVLHHRDDRFWPITVTTHQTAGWTG